MSEMRVIYKYRLNAMTNVLNLPLGAQPIHADWQNGESQLWALIDPAEERKEKRTFYFTGTGHQFPAANMKHISSFLVNGGQFVFHVFEVLG
jgi:hypothetical protein